MTADIRQLAADDAPHMHALLRMFGEAFGDLSTYTEKPPGPEYLRNLLSSESFVALVAVKDGQVVGGLVAYELKKFEQERSEFYIYDLAVAVPHRRQGIATALIGRLKQVATKRGAYVIFVQADTGAEDEPAIALYSKFGRREEVLHFDIAMEAMP
jgi:aminoglycoside 3-N-acetyltransferase I